MDDKIKLADTRIAILAQQRNAAMDQTVFWQADSAMKGEQIAALTKEIEAMREKKQKRKVQPPV